jgi:alpha-mannosidase
MSCFGKRVAVRKRGPVSEIVFEGQHPCNFHDFEVNWLTWRQRVIVADGLPYVEFVTEVDWDTHNRRLRIAFPTSTHTDDGDYEVPYGTIRRKRYDVRSYHPNGVNGDWPVTHWAAPASDKGSVAVLNRGECSYRIEGGNVLVSLLRSPTTPWCLYEPAYYRMPLFDGMRDSGKHSFSLALYPYVGDWRYTGVTEQAWGYNVPFVTACDRSAGRPMGISLKASGSMISTVKSAEDGEALVLRIFEYAGRGETVKLTLPQGYETVRRTNMLERAGGPLPASGGSCEIEMAPFKIVTLRLEK